MSKLDLQQLKSYLFITSKRKYRIVNENISTYTKTLPSELFIKYLLLLTNRNIVVI